MEWTCTRCQRRLEESDRFCRHCGHPRGAEFPRDLHHTIVENLPVGIFTLDSGARIRYWNRSMEEQTGIRRRDALGRVAFEILTCLQPYTHRITRAFEMALPLRLDQVPNDGGRAVQWPAGRGGEGQTRSFWFRPVLLEDDTTALLGLMEDITHRVRIDSRLIRSERLAAIGELAAGVAHNFNNILAAIGGDAQLLKLLAQDDRLPPQIAEAAQQIYEETMRGGRIAHDLLSFARGAEPQIRPLDVRELVRDAVRLIRNHPAARAVAIDVEIPDGLPAVEGDANQLHQVFFNLMLNALQAMPNGGTLTIGAAVRGHDQDPEAGLLDLKFHDTGVGIPREQLGRIFDPFYSRRANGSAGSGLGLPVSLAMVKGLGGDIHVTSAEGIGTTVTVSLPIVERRAAPRTGLHRQQEGRALLLDDDPHVRRTLTALLTRYGFEVVTAGEAEEGLARFEAALAEAPFDIVVTELLRSREDAFAPLRRIRALAPDVPILLLTGTTDRREVLRALECGAQFAFEKPPNFAELLEVIRQLARPPAGAGQASGSSTNAPAASSVQLRTSATRPPRTERMT